MEQWYLNAGVEKRTIDEDGVLVDGKNFLKMKENEALTEAKKRATKYLRNGNPKPQGNRFFLTSQDGRKAICFHDV